jgi:prepilin-type N-terminal cleavage/methylation domain-containing protein
MHASRSGFTLLELTVVLMVIVVLAAMTFPALTGTQGEYRVQAAADTVKGAWASARTYAMEHGRAYRFAIVPGKGNYRIAPDSPAYWSGGGSPSGEEGELATIIEAALPTGCLFSPPETVVDSSSITDDSSLPLDGVGPESWVTLAVFLPDGTAREDAQILVQARAARAILLELRSLTGAVTARPFNRENR